MTSLVEWFTVTLSDYISREMVIFLISMMPILELRGGLLAASLLDVRILTAIPICVIGNIIPIPFILLFIKKILCCFARGLNYTVVPVARRKIHTPISIRIAAANMIIHSFVRFLSINVKRQQSAATGTVHHAGL
jgi:hypothetical protein